MNTSNLQNHHPLLLDYLRNNGYCISQIQWTQRCINLVLNEGSSPEIDSYEQLYWHEVQQRGYKEDARVRKSLKSVLGNVKRFDLEGIYPRHHLYHGFLAPPKPYDLLGGEYKTIIDYYVQTARSGEKVPHTIYTERQAGTVFLLYLQQSGALSIATVTERQVLDFFLTARTSSEAKRIKTRLFRY
ncbi:MAG: hypothetical protein LBE79_02885 [Tannerella sp.]|jgi:hypothetical protein|nr:hypothetical protein [Tannerella sp.]